MLNLTRCLHKLLCSIDGWDDPQAWKKIAALLGTRNKALDQSVVRQISKYACCVCYCAFACLGAFYLSRLRN